MPWLPYGERRCRCSLQPWLRPARALVLAGRRDWAKPSDPATGTLGLYEMQ